MSDTPSETDRASTSSRSRWVVGTVVLTAVALVVGIALIQPSLPTGSGQQGGGTSPSEPAATESPAVEPSETAGASPGPQSPPASSTEPPPERPVLSLNEVADVVPGLSGRIDGIEAVQGVATGPGEVAGPAVRFTVEFENTTSSAVTLATAVVNVDYGPGRNPAAELSGPGSQPLPLEVRPGETTTGTYVFSVPTEQRDVVRITVDYSVDVAPLVFEGSAPA